MKNYLEVSLTATEPIEAHVEIITAYLSEFGFEGSAEEEQVIAYIAVGEHSETDIKVLIDELIEKGLCEKAYQIETIAPKNWNEEWEKNYFQPIIIGEQCLIKSSFHQTDLKAKYEIVIDPKMSFGTGHHATTFSVMQLMEQMDFVGKTVYDFGTGTGILAIFAEMKGAQPIDAIDIDNWCYLNSIENAERNNCRHITVYEGDAALLQDKKYDLIIANINRNILLNDMQSYVDCLNPKGTILFSGFYEEDIPFIDNSCTEKGLTYIKKFQRNNWVSLKYVN